MPKAAIEDPNLRERLVGLKLQRDELASEIAAYQQRLTAGESAITDERIARFSAILRDKLDHGPDELRQAYARLMMREVSVTNSEIRISGSKAVIAKAIASAPEGTPPAVLSFVREWCTRRDSNS
ncbi:MAG TPA: hypothetical protein VGM83_02040 [Devosiaceae bacterium]